MISIKKIYLIAVLVFALLTILSYVVYDYFDNGTKEKARKISFYAMITILILYLFIVITGLMVYTN